MMQKILIAVLVLFLGILVGAQSATTMTTQNNEQTPLSPLPSDPTQMQPNQSTVNERLGKAPSAGAITNPERRPQSRSKRNNNPANAVPSQNCEPTDIPCQQNQQLQRGTR